MVKLLFLNQFRLVRNEGAQIELPLDAQKPVFVVRAVTK
jgi:hypothetical protein